MRAQFNTIYSILNPIYFNHTQTYIHNQHNENDSLKQKQKKIKEKRTKEQKQK